jgi:hypothetical protein
MTRTEHVEWSKKRALEYVDRGDLSNAYGSMVSDLKKHKETEMHPAIELGMGLLMMGKLNTSDEMRKFIEGFH